MTLAVVLASITTMILIRSWIRYMLILYEVVVVYSNEMDCFTAEVYVEDKLFCTIYDRLSTGTFEVETPDAKVSTEASIRTADLERLRKTLIYAQDRLVRNY